MERPGKPSPDPMSPGVATPMDGGQGDEALEAHMQAFVRASKSGNARDMAKAFRAAVEECSPGGGLPGMM